MHAASDRGSQIGSGKRRAAALVAAFPLAGWLVLRAGATDWQMGNLAAGFVLLELVLIVNPVLMLVLETTFMVSLVRTNRIEIAAD